MERDEPRFPSTTRKRESVSVTGSAFTALTAPSGAVAVVLFIPQTATSLTLKGITGDTGVALWPASNPIGLPAIVPLGASPSLGIANAGATCIVEVQWL